MTERGTFAVLFGGHAGDALEIAVKGGGFGETEYVGRFLKCLRGTRLNEAFGLCCDVLLYPFARREVACGRADNFAEMLGSEVQQISVEFDLPRLPIVFYHQVAKLVEEFYMAVFSPLPVLFAAV